MKIVKPMVVSFTFRPFLMLGEQRLCVTGMVGFSLADGARRLIADTAMWAAIGESTQGIVDEGLPKPCGEVLVHGQCHVPGGRAVPVSQVRVRVSPQEPDARRTVDKKLVVLGDRFWRPGVLGSSMTDPAPFTVMPLTWERAFGGDKYPKNPLGRGFAAAEGSDQVPLPNVETPSHLVTSPSQRPEPAGFGPLEMGWPQRQSRAGTYDARWLEEDFPGYARDTDPLFFCTVPPDQRIVGFFRGDEEYLLENMHPSRPTIHGRLPDVSARILLRRKGSRDVEDVSLRIDSVIFLPEKEIGIVVFRGATLVADDEAADVDHALAACEETGDPRSVEHYTRALDRRLDKHQSPKLALYEDDLVPPFAVGANLVVLHLPQDSVGRTAAERERVLEETREAVARTGAPAPPAAPAPLEEAPNASPDAAAVPEPAATPDGQPPEFGPGPPKARAQELLETLRIASIEPDTEIGKKFEDLRRVDAETLRMYRQNAHVNLPARPLEAAERTRARETMRELRSRGESFAGLDWTRFDLSEYNLQGSDFRGTLLEGADFTRTNVTGANLSGALLAHATLRGTCFDGATLEGANLGATLMDGASFAGANLRGAIFARATLSKVSLHDADLTGVDWSRAEVGEVDFEGVAAIGLTFLPVYDLTRCRFARAKISKSKFLGTKVDGVSFMEAHLDSGTWMRCSASGADFRNASLRKLTAVEGCSFEGANFEGADSPAPSFGAPTCEGPIWRAPAWRGPTSVRAT